jgi:hypothetical protein
MNGRRTGRRLAAMNGRRMGRRLAAMNGRRTANTALKGL